MKDLVVGDIHATPDELKDCGILMELVERVAGDENVNRIVFLGDLHHTFAVTNVKVVAFYREWFKRLAKNLNCSLEALVGNHDMPGNGTQHPHALIAYEDLIRVHDKPHWTLDDTLFVPYYADPNLFHDAVNRNLGNSKLIYCHQEFNGAKYDNGFYAPHGADPMMPVPTISGHIHTPQSVGKVYYPGAPRWRTLSDANVERGLTIVQDGIVLRGIPTGEFVKRIWAIRSIEGEVGGPVPGFNSKDEFRVYIEGSPEYVKENSTLFRYNWPGCRLTTNIKNKTIRVRESDGIETAFKKFASSYKAKNATPPERLLNKAQTLIYGT